MMARGCPDAVRGALQDADGVCETVKRTAAWHVAVLPPPERKVP